jgi:putative OPT family oligopeptide transporter
MFLAPTVLAPDAAMLIGGMLIYMLVIGAIIAAVCGYMAGLIGASNSPVSGVGILAVIGAAVLLALVYGTGGDPARGQALAAFALFSTAIVFSIATISNDNLQDLKTGQLVGATPWRQQLSLVFLTGVMALNYFYLSSSIALVQEEVRPNQRVMAGALLLLIMNFIGLGLGPTYVGAASDYFKAAGHALPLQTALYTLTPFYVIAIILFLVLARRLGREQKGSAA